MKKFLLFILINIFLICNANAITLIEAIKEAYDNNPKLNAERENLKISKENINISKSNFLPTVTISGYKSAENTSKLTNRSGEDASKDDVNPLQTSILVEQKLYDQSRKPDLEKNEIGLEIARLKLKKVEQEIIYESVEAYTNLVLNNKKLEINLLNVSLLERQVETDRARLEKGEINLTDVAQSEASLAGANAKLIQVRNDIVTSKLIYEKTIGKINNSEEVNESYVFKYKLPNNLKEANIISKQFSPELNIVKLELEQANKDVAIAKSDLSPSATLSFQATQTDDTSSTYDESDKETLKATVSWPFSLGGKNLSSLRKNKSLRDQKALLLEDAKRSNEALVSSAWSNFKSSKSLLNSIRVQVKASEIANEGISIEYESGLGRSTLDVIQSNSILLDAKNNLATSQRNHFLSQYKLLLALGQLTALNLSLN
jgi:outer membrane protein